ncbi:MAG TPA: prepilin-type N-terminal cleavage/methylation domain-containing protein [Phycisphaerales bacterium]|nr:prepilin-type N-terminal cleavage/methylation domain-containing protein [Phycisphaerales bacterium]
MRAHTKRNRQHRKGLTLLETMMALTIIGVGVLAFVDAQAAFTRSNAWSSQSATAMLLANEIREFTRKLSRHDPVTGLELDNGTLRGWAMESAEVDATDIDDVDDLDGATFGNGGTFEGPIDAEGNVIPSIDLSGVIQTDEDDNIIPLQGWRQRVIVEKVDPYNFLTVRADNYQQAQSASLPFIAVDEFPLRVTVIVEYQSLTDIDPKEVTRLTFIVPR